MGDLFRSLLCSEEAQSCKPDSGIFQVALQRAGCAPDEAVFVGDTPQHDIAGAVAAGMRAVLIEETTDMPFDRSGRSAQLAVIQELPELVNFI